MSAPAAAVRPRGDADDQRNDADVIVVGAGPSGSSAAYWLATAGLDVAAAREDDVPAREGLRRRADPARHPGPDRDGHRRQRAKPAGCTTAGCASSAAASGCTSTGPSSPASRRSAWCARAPTSTRCSPTRRSRPAPGCYEQTIGHRADPRRRRAGRRRRGPHRRQEAGRRSAPRSCSPARACRGKLAQQLGVHRNDKRPLGVAVRRYYTSPKTHDDYLESWLELWDGKPERVGPAARLRLDLRHGRRHGQRRARRAQLQRRVPEDRLPRDAHPLAGQHPGGVGAARAERHLPDPRRGAADGVQPHAALPARAAARRRLRRLGEPVQRRGHPVRDGVGQVRRRGRRAGARPARRARPRARARGLSGADARPSGAPTTASAACS